MILPRKDENGIPYVSYSQINMFKNDPVQYYNSYVLNKPFEGNVWTDFGSDVGKALETGNFMQFSDIEQLILGRVTRLEFFEVETKLWYGDEFYVKGFIDTTDFEVVIDYKTGGKNKELLYSSEEYTQVQLYALALRDEGFVIRDGWVEFIRREGNPYRGQDLKVAQEPPLIIKQDVSITTLERIRDKTYDEVLKISEWYKTVI